VKDHDAGSMDEHVYGSSEHDYDPLRCKIIFDLNKHPNVFIRVILYQVNTLNVNPPPNPNPRSGLNLNWTRKTTTPTLTSPLRCKIVLDLSKHLHVLFGPYSIRLKLKPQPCPWP